jgi:hypothetical protein
VTTRSITTSQVEVRCDVCGRSLLRGEHADVFLSGGSRRTVCELCTARAAHEGWIREGLDDSLGVRQRSGADRARSLLGRLRERRDAAVRAQSERAEPATSDEPPEPGRAAAAAARRPETAGSPVRDPRPVRAVPTNADLKVARALDVFNASSHPRTVAGVARSLGEPFVTVRPARATGSVVSIVVGWELCWYRYEVDLADEAAGVRVSGQGAELGELEPADHNANAAADDRGELQFLAAAAR